GGAVAQGRPPPRASSLRRALALDLLVAECQGLLAATDIAPRPSSLRAALAHQSPVPHHECGSTPAPRYRPRRRPGGPQGPLIRSPPCHRPCRKGKEKRMKMLSKRRLLLTATLVLAAAAAVMGSQALAGAKDTPGAAKGLGQLSGLLPRDHLTTESAIQVDLSKETVRLPLYKGKANGKTVWYVLLDASDAGLAHDLGVNYAPKLANIGIGCPACVQTVTLDDPTPAQNPFGPALVDFQGAPDFSPTRIAVPGPNGFPLAKFQPGAVAGSGYSPFIQIAGSPVVYNAPIVATGDGPFDVVHHTNTGDRVLGIHIAPSTSPSGQFLESYVDLLFVKG